MCYDGAEAIRPVNNDDSVLRWNACVRLLALLPEPAADRHEQAAITSE